MSVMVARGAVTFIVGDALGDDLMRPGGVVVPQILGQHPAQMVLIDDCLRRPGERGGCRAR